MCPPDYYGIEYEINPWMNRRGRQRPGRVAAAVARAARDAGRPGRDDRAARAGARACPTWSSRPTRGWSTARPVPQLAVPLRRPAGGDAALRPLVRASTGSASSRCPRSSHFEGAGDALFCGETLFAGYRFRSDARSHQWVGERLGVEVLPLELVDPRFYHLDTCFCPLAEDEAIYYPGAFDDYGRSVLATGSRRLIEVSAEEAVSFSCNAVVVGRTVVLNEGAPKLAGRPARSRLRGPAPAA